MCLPFTSLHQQKSRSSYPQYSLEFGTVLKCVLYRKEYRIAVLYPYLKIMLYRLLITELSESQSIT